MGLCSGLMTVHKRFYRCLKCVTNTFKVFVGWNSILYQYLILNNITFPSEFVIFLIMLIFKEIKRKINQRIVCSQSQIGVSPIWHQSSFSFLLVVRNMIYWFYFSQCLFTTDSLYVLVWVLSVLAVPLWGSGTWRLQVHPRLSLSHSSCHPPSSHSSSLVNCWQLTVAQCRSLHLSKLHQMTGCGWEKWEVRMVVLWCGWRYGTTGYFIVKQTLFTLAH